MIQYYHPSLLQQERLRMLLTLKKMLLLKKLKVSWLETFVFLSPCYHLLFSEVCGSTNFCQCNKCQWMPTEPERICCQAKKFLIKMPNNTCVTLHEDFDQIINKVTLIKFIWIFLTIFGLMVHYLTSPPSARVATMSDMQQ